MDVSLEIDSEISDIEDMEDDSTAEVIAAQRRHQVWEGGGHCEGNLNFINPSIFVLTMNMYSF